MHFMEWLQLGTNILALPVVTGQGNGSKLKEAYLDWMKIFFFFFTEGAAQTFIRPTGNFLSSWQALLFLPTLSYFS